MNKTELLSMSNKVLIATNVLDKDKLNLLDIAYLISIGDFYYLNKDNKSLKNINNFAYNLKSIKKSVFFLSQIELLEITNNGFFQNVNCIKYFNNLHENSKNYLILLKKIYNDNISLNEEYYLLSQRYMKEIYGGD